MVRTIINPQYPGMLAVDVMDHAMDLISVARLGINAFEADPSNVSEKDMASIAYVLMYALDLLKPVREQLNSEEGDALGVRKAVRS